MSEPRSGRNLAVSTNERIVAAIGGPNAARAVRGSLALEAYVAAGGGDPEDVETSLVDLAADLLHLAAGMYEYDPTTGMGTGAHWLARLAMSHYDAERKG